MTRQGQKLLAADELRFANDVALPWEELNALLVERLVFHVDLSRLSRLVAALAVSINHQTDMAGWKADAACSASHEHRLIRDVADQIKHQTLRDVGRQNRVQAASDFEVNEQGDFRFLRTSLLLGHSTLGPHDFMSVARKAAQFWIAKRGLGIDWDPKVREAANLFYRSAWLVHDPTHSPVVQQVRLRRFVRDQNGTLVAADGEFRYEIYDLGAALPTPIA